MTDCVKMLPFPFDFTMTIFKATVGILLLV